MPTVLVERANLSNSSINFLDFFHKPTSMGVNGLNETVFPHLLFQKDNLVCQIMICIFQNVHLILIGLTD